MALVCVEFVAAAKVAPHLKDGSVLPANRHLLK